MILCINMRHICKFSVHGMRRVCLYFSSTVTCRLVYITLPFVLPLTWSLTPSSGGSCEETREEILSK